MIEEGCISGLGARQLIRFTTHIKNIGNQDFYVGSPPNNPTGENESWEWDQCHQHWHYEGYAEYLVFDEFGNETPVGVKNGFCLIDIECSGGGQFTYNCGNQGISAGCGDIYGSGLDCQWVDITNLADGIYTLMVRVNWDGSPDANGLYESSYDNNDTQICFELTRDNNNNASISILNTGCSFEQDCINTTLSITLDQYPEETTWRIEDLNANVIAGGNNYDLPGTPATVSHDVCLAEGCYNLIMLDSGNDGLCCAFGSGSFQLSDASGITLAEGSEFTNELVINFCVAPPPACTDNDNDGICIEDDCDDTDNTLPAPPGVACDDNDPHTENDVIQADGCSCTGTPVSPPSDPCDLVQIVPGNNRIEILNIGTDNFPHINIQIFTSSWQQIDICVDNCGNPYLIEDLDPGEYLVSVKPFNSAWQDICNLFETVEVTGASGPCTDADGDGVCLNQDCDDNDPSLPATAGTSCDDQNANTENDVILADGCTCEGTMVQTGDCAALDITTLEGGLSVVGTGGFPFVNIQIFNELWQRVDNCSGQCNDPYIVSNLPEGLYHVSVKTFDNTWSPVCDIFEDHYVSGQSGPCTDEDNDGVCAYQDCDDTDPSLPAAAGTACDDGNAVTENDVILSDGCTCEGVAPAPPSDCDVIEITGGAGSISISNLELFPNPTVQVQTDQWTPVSLCFDNCVLPYFLDGLDPGNYIVTVKVYSENWTEICRIDQTVTVTSNMLSVVNGLASNPFIFEAGLYGEQAQLEWIVNNENLTNRFEIEKSVDGVVFEKLGSITANGISTDIKRFKGVDKNLLAGENTYRIKQIYIDGSWRYSEMRKVNAIHLIDVPVFPNPAEDVLYIDLKELNGAGGTFTISTLFGLEILQKDIQNIKSDIFELNVSDLSSGVYSIYFDIEGRKGFTQKVVISKR